MWKWTDIVTSALEPENASFLSPFPHFAHYIIHSRALRRTPQSNIKTYFYSMDDSMEFERGESLRLVDDDLSAFESGIPIFIQLNF